MNTTDTRDLVLAILRAERNFGKASPIQTVTPILRYTRDLNAWLKVNEVHSDEVAEEEQRIFEAGNVMRAVKPIPFAPEPPQATKEEAKTLKAHDTVMSDLDTPSAG